MDTQRFDEVTIEAAAAVVAREPAIEAELLPFAREARHADCIHGNGIEVPALRGKASDYRASYERSMANMLERIKAAGCLIEPVYGPRGGRPKTWLVY